MIIILEIFTTFSLLGLIWTIQLVHYPSFRYVSETKFKEFILFHGRSISLIVMPLMIVELVIAVLISNQNPDVLSFIKLALVACVWLSTFTLSVPRHSKLLKMRDEKIIESLIKTNWPRTILWSIKAIIIGLNF